MTARKDPLYKAQPGTDGLYHCPFERSENCKHQPEKLKCNYEYDGDPYLAKGHTADILRSKHLDSHLKPYRCSRSECSNLQFSSTACLLRHEREAHALHGHGDKPYRCRFRGCDRAQHGQGFPRLWNLRDHMKRVHDFIEESSESKYPTPESSHSSDEAIGPYVRRRSPDMCQAGVTKRSRMAKSSKKEIPLAWHHEQYQHLKEYTDLTYANLDPQNPVAVERYHADQARLQAMAQNMPRMESHRSHY